MGNSRKIVIATALIVLVVGALFVGDMLLDRETVRPDPVGASAGATPAATPGATLPGTDFPADSPAAAADSGPDRGPQSGALPDLANAQEVEPDYAYRGATPPASSEVPQDAGNEWRRAFENEERDEAWAGPLEAEIRNSLEPEINLGRFYLANAECRATLCEIRLLARGSLQRAELDLFQSTIYTLPWAADLDPALSSGVDSGDGYESIWIFERRPVSP